MFFLDPQFLKAATERAVKTAAQTVVVSLGADQMLDAFHADWETLGGVTLGGLVLSYLTSFASGMVGERETPSVVGETLASPQEPQAFGPDELAVDDDRPTDA